MLLDGSLHAVIANWQNIGTPQGKYQEHVRRPDADALDLGEMRDDVVFGHVGHALKLKQPSLGFLGEITQVSSLLTGKSDPAHLRVSQFDNALGTKFAASQGSESVEDCGRGFAVQLLIKDRFGQGVQRGLTKLHSD